MDERRNFVRLKKRIKVMYKYIIDRFASTTAPPNITYTDSLSGNGMVIFSPKKIEKGKKLEISIEVPDGNKKTVDLAGEVLGVNELNENENEIRIKFTEIDEPDRDRLVRYILKEGVKKKG